MGKVIKVNLESKQVSLIEGEIHTSLFHQKNLSGTGIYLNRTQEYTYTTEQNQNLILFILSGSGELQFKENLVEPITLQATRGDLFYIPNSMYFKISNLTTDIFIAAIIEVNFTLSH